MVVIASILILSGVFALVVGAMLKRQAGQIANTPLVPTGEAAGEGPVSVQGRPSCAQLLTAPASGTPCLYYSLTVTGSWKAGNERKTATYHSVERAAELTLDDGLGPVTVDLSGGGDLGQKASFNKHKKEGFFADSQERDRQEGAYPVRAVHVR